MKKNLFILSLTLLFIPILIFSCRKDLTNLDTESAEKNSQNIESAKIFYAQGATLNVKSYRALFTDSDKASLSTGKSVKRHLFYKLAPIWKDAFEVKASNGSQLIVAPTKENGLEDKSFTIRRFFIFTKSKGVVTGGKIVEFLGKNYSLDGNIIKLIAGYQSEQYYDLNGAIFIYDLNYFFNKGIQLKNGKKTDEAVKLQNLELANKSTKKTNDLTGCTTCDPNICYSVWLVHYENGVEMYRDFIGYSDGCYSQPPSGSDSGYDTSSNYGGGGAPYGGNEEIPEYEYFDEVLISGTNPGALTTDPNEPGITYYCRGKVYKSSTGRITKVEAGEVVAQPMSILYQDEYQRYTTRTLTLIDNHGSYTLLSPTSVRVSCYCEIHGRYIYSDKSPVFTTQVTVSDSKVY